MVIVELINIQIFIHNWSKHSYQESLLSLLKFVISHGWK
jgi:hypothetical protein